MSWDPFGLLEAEAEDERHMARLRQGRKLFWFGIIEPPVYIRTGQVIPGYPAHWIVRFWNMEYGHFIPAVGYPLDTTKVKS